MSEIAAYICDLVLVSPPKDHYLRGRDPKEIVTLLSSKIPKNKILDDVDFTLSQWISLSKSKLGGRILFVVFSVITSPKVDIFQETADNNYLSANL
jgi:hypothetical protein